MGKQIHLPGGDLQLACYQASISGRKSLLALYWHNTGWKTVGYWYSSETSLGWELFVGIGAVLKMVLRLHRKCQYWGVTANGIVPVTKVCTGALLDLVPKVPIK